MKTKLFILLISMYGAIALNAQEIKHYSGTYGAGTAEYDYYEREDGSRAMHGVFQAKKTEVAAYKDRYTYDIKGHYKDDKRDGEWVISFNNVANRQKVTGKLVVNYNSGIHEGSYEAKMTVSEPVKPESRYVMAANSTNNVSVAFECVNNTPNGPIKVVLNDLSWTGQMFEGNKVGIWKIIANKFSYMFDAEKNEGYGIDSETGDRLPCESFPRERDFHDLFRYYLSYYETLTDSGLSSQPNPKKFVLLEM